MLVQKRDPLPPLHDRTVVIIIVKPDMTISAATKVPDKIALLQNCSEEDIVVVASAQPWTVEVFIASPEMALEKLQEGIPKDPLHYYFAFGERP